MPQPDRCNRCDTVETMEVQRYHEGLVNPGRQCHSRSHDSTRQGFVRLVSYDSLPPTRRMQVQLRRSSRSVLAGHLSVARHNGRCALRNDAAPELTRSLSLRRRWLSDIGHFLVVEAIEPFTHVVLTSAKHSHATPRGALLHVLWCTHGSSKLGLALADKVRTERGICSRIQQRATRLQTPAIDAVGPLGTHFTCRHHMRTCAGIICGL